MNAGSYTIVPGGLSSGNYAIVFNDGKLNIGARVPAIPGAPISGYTGAIASVGVIAADTGVSTGAAGNAAASPGVVTLAVESGDSAASSNAQGGSNAQGASKVASLSEDGATDYFSTDYFTTRYLLVMHGCGLRLPAGLSCR